MRKKTKLFTLFAFLSALVFVFGSQQTWGQATTGGIRGTVTDPNGQVVQNATVVAKNEGTGIETNTTSNNDGFFAVENLIPGNYTVTVSTATGFKTKTTTGVAVQLGVDRELKVDLEVGGASEIVTIVASTEEVAQTNSEISSNFESKKISELPSNAAGSGIDTLALNIPGVTPGFGNVNSNGITLSVNGNRARSNNFTIDGTDNNDLSIGGPALFISNADAVQEFQVVSSNFSAEYGRNQGAVINIVTKSGKNDFFGSAFEYHRNASLLDAQTNLERRNPNRSKRDKFISNTFGGTFGGPIWRNKAFFFGSYQGIRQRQNFTSRSGNLAILASEFPRLRAAFPTNAAINALTSQGAFALTGFGVVRPRGDRAIDRVCISATPATNCVVGTNETGFYQAAFPEREFGLPFDQNDYTARGDWNITDKDLLTVLYLHQSSVSGNGLGDSNGFTGDIPATSKKFRAAYSRTLTSDIVNSFNFTAQRLSVVFGGGCTDPLTGCIPDPAKIGEAYTSARLPE